MHELSMAVAFSLKAGGLAGLLKQSGYGLRMLRRGKMPLIPERFKAGKEIEKIFRASEDKNNESSILSRLLAGWYGY